MNWQNKKVLVVGMARSGIAAARLLAQMGADVTVNDSKPAEELGNVLAPLEGLNIRYVLGCPAAEAARETEALILSPGVPAALGFVQDALARNIPVWSEIELGYTQTACPICAITGTNGKTTTVTLMGEILKNAGFTTYVDGNIGRPLTEDVTQITSEDRVVLEVSSYQLEAVRSFRPAVSAILNLTEDHLARHKTMEGYLEAKARIFMNQRDDDVCVLNADDPMVCSLKDRPACRVWFFSRKHPVDNGAYAENGQVMLARNGEPRVLLSADQIGIPGDHNLENALAAAAMSMAMGVPDACVRDTLIRFSGVEHRIESVAEVNGVTFINDSKATNVDATLVAIRTMKKPTILIAGGSYKVMNYEPMIRAMTGAMKGMVLVGATAREIADTCDRLGYTDYRLAETFEEAVRTAQAMCPEGGNVLLSPACASFDFFTDFEHRGRVFKQIVNRIAEESR